MGSEMCIRDRVSPSRFDDGARASQVDGEVARAAVHDIGPDQLATCLLYTSDAADERSSVDLGGRRIIKKTTRRADHGDSSVT